METEKTIESAEIKKPSDKIAWHPGFYGGLELELRRWKADLIFQEEHTLSKQPLKMDMLIIKKSRDVAIDFSYGRAFREYNVIEYKSPEDTLSIDAFYKTIGYACLYKGTGETENAIPEEELTVTMFCFHHPKNLLTYLAKKGAQVRAEGGGLYQVDGKYPFTLQIVVTQELEDNDEHPLRLLTKDVEIGELQDYVRKVRDVLKEPGDQHNAAALLHVCYQAYNAAHQNREGESAMTEQQLVSLIFGNKLEEVREEAKEEALKEERERTVLDMLSDHLPLNSIMKYSKLSVERIMDIAQSNGIAVIRG